VAPRFEIPDDEIMMRSGRGLGFNAHRGDRDDRVAPRSRPLLGEFPLAWPAFMYEDPTGSLYYADAATTYPEFVMLAIDDQGSPVARSFSVPLSWAGDPTGPLPDAGWDWVVRTAHETRSAGATPNLVSALEITIQPDRRGAGLSAIRTSLRRYDPTQGRPHRTLGTYAVRARDDGLPIDPWLRVHVRAGGRVLNITPTSMTIPGTLARWRAWTGLPFDTSGPVDVPGALVPVMCAAEHDVAVYVEPNVWVHHHLGR
jgi:hypothetical protein